MDNNLTIKERILQLAKSKRFTAESFCDKVGITYGNLKGANKKTPINSNTIANIFSIIPDLNLNWLITGKGEMLINKPENQEKTEIQVKPEILTELEKLRSLMKEKEETVLALKNVIEAKDRGMLLMERVMDGLIKENNILKDKLDVDSASSF